DEGPFSAEPPLLFQPFNRRWDIPLLRYGKLPAAARLRDQRRGWTVQLMGGCAGRAGRRRPCRCARSKPDRLNGAVGLGLGQLATGVSGFISYDFCRLAGRVPRPSFTFLFQGASMRCFVSSSIDLGSRLRWVSISPAATAVIVA